jgi:hypothetical protein
MHLGDGQVLEHLGDARCISAMVRRWTMHFGDR